VTAVVVVNRIGAGVLILAPDPRLEQARAQRRQIEQALDCQPFTRLASLQLDALIAAEEVLR
jgi:hypothetical protein